MLAYCIMGNHFHMLLEVPPRLETGLSADSLDHALFAKRLAGIYKPGEVAEIMQMLSTALEATDGSEASRVRVTEEIAGPYLVRMHDLSAFMNGVLKRFTRWFNRRHERTGTLWEDRFKSVIVEDGVPARTVAAYIDLNPVRAGMVVEPADYRWSSYGEAVGAGGRSVAGRAARGGLVRALLCSSGVEDDASLGKDSGKNARAGRASCGGMRHRRRACSGRCGICKIICLEWLTGEKPGETKLIAIKQSTVTKFKRRNDEQGQE